MFSRVKSHNFFFYNCCRDDMVKQDQEKTKLCVDQMIFLAYVLDLMSMLLCLKQCIPYALCYERGKVSVL